MVVHLFIHSFAHSLTHSFIHSLTHSFIHSCVRPFVQPVCLQPCRALNCMLWTVNVTAPVLEALRAADRHQTAPVMRHGQAGVNATKEGKFEQGDRKKPEVGLSPSIRGGRGVRVGPPAVGLATEALLKGGGSGQRKQVPRP